MSSRVRVVWDMETSSRVREWPETSSLCLCHPRCCLQKAATKSVATVGDQRLSLSLSRHITRLRAHPTTHFRQLLSLSNSRRHLLILPLPSPLLLSSAAALLVHRIFLATADMICLLKLCDACTLWIRRNLLVDCMINEAAHSWQYIYYLCAWILSTQSGIGHVEVVSHKTKIPRSCRAIKLPRTEPPPGAPHLEPLLPALCFLFK